MLSKVQLTERKISNFNAFFLLAIIQQLIANLICCDPYELTLTLRREKTAQSFLEYLVHIGLCFIGKLIEEKKVLNIFVLFAIHKLIILFKRFRQQGVCTPVG